MSGTRRSVRGRWIRCVSRLPWLGPFVEGLWVERLRRRFRGSQAYWVDRYAHGGDSGRGSLGELACFKAALVNAFVARHDIQSVIEHGSGDGSQLALARYPRYLGLDVSRDAVDLCRARFLLDSTRRFALVDDYGGERADLALSLDVIYHLVEDDVYDSYMRRLFASARRFVIIYSSNRDDQRRRQPPHVRHRRFCSWVEQHEPEFRLIQHVRNPYPYEADSRGSFADFYVFRRGPGEEDTSWV